MSIILPATRTPKEFCASRGKQNLQVREVKTEEEWKKKSGVGEKVE
jgi:hypothetical protein